MKKLFLLVVFLSACGPDNWSTKPSPFIDRQLENTKCTWWTYNNKTACMCGGHIVPYNAWLTVAPDGMCEDPGSSFKLD